ncbi:MAG TPA: hypothetical protein VJN88_02595, partial [Ktedonobacterales bacterium]|nr:hypothetical protein [Ktedonobacterales bacterium]
MNPQQIRDIANAVLYEGYLLYPYRHSAMKNRQRWTIGVVYPREYSEATGGVEPWAMRTECLVTGGPDAALDVTVRFLHLLTRGAGEGAGPGAIGWSPDSWQEGMEREETAAALPLGNLLDKPRRVPFAFPAARMTEPDEQRPGQVITREQAALSGSFTVTAERVNGGPDAYKLTVQIENTTPLRGGIPDSYNAAMPMSLISAHTVLRVNHGAFVSLLDPPERLRAAAAGCHNERTYPVLVGDEGDTDTMLSSPIILYDYPQIAPESAGALFDGTEIDEIL